MTTDFEDRIRGALETQARRVDATPAMYEVVTDRIGARRRRTGLLALAAAAVVVIGAAIAIPALLGDDQSAPEIIDRPDDVVDASAGLPVGHVVASGNEVAVIDADGSELFSGPTCTSCGPVHAVAVHPSSTVDEVTYATLSSSRDDPGRLVILTTTLGEEEGSSNQPAVSLERAPEVRVDPDDPTYSLAPRSDRPLDRPGMVFSPDGDRLAWSTWDGERTWLAVAPFDVDAGVDHLSAVRLAVDLDGPWRLTGWAWDAEYDDGRTGVLSFATLGSAALVEVADTALGLEVLDTVLADAEVFGFALGGMPYSRGIGGAVLEPADGGDGPLDLPPVVLSAATTPTDIVRFDDEAPVFAGRTDGGRSYGVRLPQTADFDPGAVDLTEVDLTAASNSVAVALGDRILLRAPSVDDALQPVGPRDLTNGWTVVDVPADVVAAIADERPAPPRVSGSITQRTDPPSTEPGADTPTTPAWVVVNTGTRFWIERVDGGGRIELGSTAPELAVDAIEVRPGGTPDLLDSVMVRRLTTGGWEFNRMNRVDGSVSFTGFPPQYQPDPATQLGAPVPAFSPDGRHLAWVEGTRDEVTLRTIGWTDRVPGTGNTADDNASFTLDIDLVGDELTVQSWTWWDELSLVRPDVRDAAYPTQAVGSLLLVDDLGLAYGVEVERQADGALTVRGFEVVSHVEEPPAGWVTTRLFELTHADDLGNVWAADLSWPPSGGVKPGGRSSLEYRPYLLDGITWGDPADVAADAWAEGLLVTTDGRGWVVTTVGSRQLDGTIVDLDWLTGDVVR